MLAAKRSVALYTARLLKCARDRYGSSVKQQRIAAGADFEFEAFWWEPVSDDEPKEAQGTLRYTAATGAVLSIVDLHPGPQGIFGLEQQMPVLHGRTLTGKACTLFDA